MMMAKAKKVKTSDSPDIILSELEKIGCKIRREISELKPKFFISTGLFGLDHAISTKGGVPSNCIVEIWGPNSTGKTSVALQIAQQAQNTGMRIFYINSERAINDSIAKIFLTKNVEWIDPLNGEVALDTIKIILKTQKNCLVINDSIPGCLPSKIDEGNIGDSHIGLQARMFSQFMPSAQHYCKTNNHVLVQLNQERANISPMSRGGKVTCGGNAVPFYSDIRIKLSVKYKGGDILSGEEKIGHIIEAKIMKTRYGSPFQVAELPLIYGVGFDTGRELLTCAELYGMIQKGGSWYAYTREGETEPVFNAQGSEKMASWIRQNPNIQKELKDRMTKLLI
jgi:recombination protein RecA